jgi:colicin import membrane protein
MNVKDYRKAFGFSLAIHLGLMILLLIDPSTQQAALTPETKTPGFEQNSPEVVKAVSVDNQQVMEEMKQIKMQREQQKQAEVAHQNELKHQADLAKQQRVKAQQQLEQLKAEANKIAVARQKQAEEEKKHLKELEKQQQLEAKRLLDLKKQQTVEAEKLAALNKKKAEEEKQRVAAEKQKAAKAKIAAKAREAKAAAAAKAKQEALENAQNQARLAGVVDKYKALIVNAIGRNWILPEHTDRSLSSQFRIRLGVDGTVLEVSLTRSSGDPLLDRSAQTAIYKASPLPVPSDPDTFNLFRDISLTVRPEQVRG